MGESAALELILEGRRVAARSALGLGLIDAVAEDLTTDSLCYALAIDPKAALPRTSVRSPALPDADPGLFDAVRSARSADWRGQVAPWKIVDCVEASTHLEFEDGVLFEREAFLACAASPQHKALTYLFQAERALKKTTLDASGAAECLRDALRREARTMMVEGMPAHRIAQAAEAFGFSPAAIHFMLNTDVSRGPTEAQGEVSIERLVLALAREADDLAEKAGIGDKGVFDAIAVRQVGFPSHRGGAVYSRDSGHSQFTG